MRRTVCSLLALLTLCSPAGVSASVFDLMYTDTAERGPSSYPSNQILDFTISEMKRWGRNGIKLSRDDVKNAFDNALQVPDGSGFCQNKVDNDDKAIVFQAGAGDADCTGARNAVMSLIAAEKTAEQLGDTLLMAANGSELSIADEPHRPVRVGTLALILQRLRLGTGSGLIPWNGASLDSRFDTLDTKLAALDPDDLEKAVQRFHFGYFRGQNEDDPRFSGIAPDVESALSDLASGLGIIGSGSMVGEFSTPLLKKVKNVAFWARKDDVGLQWVYPVHFPRLELKIANGYPLIATGSIATALSYPFSYTGVGFITDPPAFTRSPLCNRTVGRHGYLCRRNPVPRGNCKSSNTGSISLVECPADDPSPDDPESSSSAPASSSSSSATSSSFSSSSFSSSSTSSSSSVSTVDIIETTVGPDVCRGLLNLFADDGTALVDPVNPVHLNPALTPAATKNICTPEMAVKYQDDVVTHACYIAHCLAQSMSGHTLVPNRNTVLTNEGTSPYLACMRQDPQLGLYAESPHKPPFTPPPYLGLLLVQDFEREYCLKNGDAARAVLGDCAFRANRIAQSPSYDQVMVTDTIFRNATAVSGSQQDFLSLALLIGQRASLEQAIPVQAKLFATVAGAIRQMADLFLELRRAPLTTTACPWTGPFKEFAP